MRTLGLDMSVDDKKTWLACIDWDGAGGAQVLSVENGLSNSRIVERVREVENGVMGVDCPFGWPAAFIDLLVAHRAGTVDFEIGVPARWRDHHAKRATDLYVQARADLSVTPLSVSADKIGQTAMRCAVLLAELVSKGVDVARDGRRGAVVEVYPAASLNAWRLRHDGYKDKKNRLNREALVEDLLDRRAPFLRVAPGLREVLCESDDAFDAVIAALSARAARRDLAEGPQSPEDLDSARTEGWIWVPKSNSLDRLAS